MVRRLVALLFCALWCGVGCTKREDPPLPDGPIRVVATTGIVADLIRSTGADGVEVVALMGPGVDPHLYKPVLKDLERLRGAEVVFYNGAHLEGKMTEMLEQLGRRTKVVNLAGSLDSARLRSVADSPGYYDPHLWLDIGLWSELIPVIVSTLTSLRPDRAEEFAARGEAYREELLHLDRWVREQVASIPGPQRVLVTAHDAFGYFGQAYGLEVVALQGLSTATEFGLFDIQRVVETVATRRVRAIFVENSVPERFLSAVQAGVRARGGEVQLGGELFSDALGGAGTPAGTYIGMIRANVQTIVTALGGTVTP